MKHSTVVLIALSLFFSCKKERIQVQLSKQLKSVLVLGNSITIHPPDPGIGWYGNWGMAATSADKDYIHLLGAKLSAKITPVNISGWENDPTKFDLNTLSVFFTSQPDLILLRLGENVNDLKGFYNALDLLVQKAKKDAPDAKIVITGTFWKYDALNDILTSYAKDHSIPFIALSHLDSIADISYLGAPTLGENGLVYAITNPSVAAHPGDNGMREIANAIYSKLVVIYK